jgi:hypothetical protein
MNKKITNPICAILWEDAHFSYQEDTPADTPAYYLIPKSMIISIETLSE